MIEFLHSFFCIIHILYEVFIERQLHQSYKTLNICFYYYYYFNMRTIGCVKYYFFQLLFDYYFITGSNSGSLNGGPGCSVTVISSPLNSNHIEETGGQTETSMDISMCESTVVVPLSASRLRLLQDTTMIESALDLDSLEEASVGAGSQAGLLRAGGIV